MPGSRDIRKTICLGCAKPIGYVQSTSGQKHFDLRTGEKHRCTGVRRLSKREAREHGFTLAREYGR